MKSDLIQLIVKIVMMVLLTKQNHASCLLHSDLVDVITHNAPQTTKFCCAVIVTSISIN